MTLSRGRLLVALCALASSLASSGAGAYALDHLQTSDDIGLSKAPHEGTSHILVIPTRVGVTAFPRAQLSALERYFDPDGGPGTFRHYWQVQSRGRYDPIPHLVDPVLYTDRCPLPGKTVQNCRLYVEDLLVLTQGALRDAFTDLLERVRDEQDLDLSQFDVNGMTPGQPDGFFDGVIVDTDMFSGIGLPLAALGHAVTVATTPLPLAPVVDGGPGDGGPLDGGPLDGGLLDGGLDGGAVDAGGDAGPPGPTLTLGVAALIPPETHEFGHNLGFIDLYGGPTVTGLMARESSGLSAFSRLAIGWGEVVDVTEPGEVLLPPVLEDGTVLRFGAPPRYILVENRGGTQHGTVDDEYPGLYVYSVDESALPQGPLGFVDLSLGDLYLPNRAAPFLAVNLPLGCARGAPGGVNVNAPCVLSSEGAQRDLQHASGEHLGFHIRFGARESDGSVRVQVLEGPLALEPDAGAPDAGALDAGNDDAGGKGEAAPGCGCRASGAPADAGALALLLVAGLALLGARRRA